MAHSVYSFLLQEMFCLAYHYGADLAPLKTCTETSGTHLVPLLHAVVRAHRWVLFSFPGFFVASCLILGLLRACFPNKRVLSVTQAFAKGSWSRKPSANSGASAVPAARPKMGTALCAFDAAAANHLSMVRPAPARPLPPVSPLPVPPLLPSTTASFAPRLRGWLCFARIRRRRPKASALRSCSRSRTADRGCWCASVARAATCR